MSSFVHIQAHFFFVTTRQRPSTGPLPGICYTFFRREAHDLCRVDTHRKLSGRCFSSLPHRPHLGTSAAVQTDLSCRIGRRVGRPRSGAYTFSSGRLGHENDPARHHGMDHLAAVKKTAFPADRNTAGDCSSCRRRSTDTDASAAKLPHARLGFDAGRADHRSFDLGLDTGSPAASSLSAHDFMPGKGGTVLRACGYGKRTSRAHQRKSGRASFPGTGRRYFRRKGSAVIRRRDPGRSSSDPLSHAP